MRMKVGGLVLAAVLVVLTVWLVGRPVPETEQFTVPDLVVALESPSAQDAPILVFADATDESGIAFQYENGAAGRLHLPETFGGGVALLDYDGDGWLDIYLVQGGPFPPGGTNPDTNRLYRNNRDGTFSDVTEQAGVGDRGYGQGCTAGDYDNDGDIDVYVTNYGPDLLLHNNGDGTFRDTTASAGLGHDIVSQQLGPRDFRDTTIDAGQGEAMWGVGCAFGDLDGDGDLDLYVATYAHLDVEHHQTCRDNANHLVHCPPTHYRGQRDVLYRNNGDGTFTDVTEEAGIADKDGRGMGVVIADLNQDGQADIYVANDQSDNYYFESAGPLVFEEHAAVQGVARNDDGRVEGSMGVAYGDIDGDGWGDLMVTNFEDETNTVYLGGPEAVFREATVPMGLGPATKNKVAWGTQFVDFNNDGRLDVFVANGHVDDVEQDTQVPYAMEPQVFSNKSGRFVDVSGSAGPYFQQRWVGRGAAFGDLDNDGDLDVAVTHLPYKRSRFTVLRNETPQMGRVLILQLAGRPGLGNQQTGSNRSAIGARVTAQLGDRRVVREVIGGGSYLSASDARVFVGVGEADRIDRLEIRWPSGGIQVWTNVELEGAITAWRVIEQIDAKALPRFAP